MPTDSVSPPPDSTSPPPDTTSPPPDTTSPPPDSTSPPPDTTNPPPDTTSPPLDTSLPPDTSAIDGGVTVVATAAHDTCASPLIVSTSNLPITINADPAGAAEDYVAGQVCGSGKPDLVVRLDSAGASSLQVTCGGGGVSGIAYGPTCGAPTDATSVVCNNKPVSMTPSPKTYLLLCLDVPRTFVISKP